MSAFKGAAAVAVAAWLAAACGPGGGGTSKATGTLHVGVEALTSADVNGVLYTLVCEDGTEMEQYVELEDQGLPNNIDPDQAGAPFADWFAVLPVTTCTVTATAMVDPTTPAEGCSVAVATVDIVADETTEIVLPIICGAEPTGALDVITIIQDGLSIVWAGFDPSKFIVQCEEVSFTVDVDGGDGSYVYVWEVIGTPTGATYTASGVGDTFTFYSEAPGTYTVKVTVTDGSGNSTSLTFPIHVGLSNAVEHCDEVCCQMPDGAINVTPQAACEAAGGVIQPLDVCEAEVCCRQEDGTYSQVAAMNCPIENVAPEEKCQEGCCKLPSGAYVLLVDQKCTEQGGTVLAHELCQQEVCKGYWSQLVHRARPLTPQMRARVLASRVFRGLPEADLWERVEGGAR